MKGIFKQAGVTLIELIVVVAIIGILAGITYPNLVDYVREARRAEAMAQLLILQMAQEEYRLKNASYADLAALFTPSRSDYYTFSVSNIGAQTYTLEATAVGTQTDDTGCALLSLNQSDEKTPVECW